MSINPSWQSTSQVSRGKRHCSFGPLFPLLSLSPPPPPPLPFLLSEEDFTLARPRNPRFIHPLLLLASNCGFLVISQGKCNTYQVFMLIIFFWIYYVPGSGESCIARGGVVRFYFGLVSMPLWRSRSLLFLVARGFPHWKNPISLLRPPRWSL